MQQSILLNIGNTHTQYGVYSVGGLTLLGVALSADLIRDTGCIQALDDQAPILAACVVPDVERVLIKVFGTRYHSLCAATASGVDFSGVDSSTLGADRVANAVAASRLLPLPVVVVDCGTCITTEIVDTDCRFLGGSITPGRALCRRALQQGTGQLPHTSLGSEPPPYPGTNTHQAIASGIDQVLLGGIERLLQQASELLRGTPSLVAVGGDAPFFIRQLPQLQPGPPNLTLRGLAFCAERLLNPAAHR